MKHVALFAALLCCGCSTNVYDPGHFEGRYDFATSTGGACAPNIYPLALCLIENGDGQVSVELISSNGEISEGNIRLSGGPTRVTVPLVAENAVDVGVEVEDPDNERTGSGVIRVRVYAKEPPVLGALWHFVYPNDLLECSGQQDAIGEATIGACN